MEITALLQSLQTALPPAERESLHQRLEHYVNYLICNDFSRLVQLLYTVDVDEQKLKTILRQQPERDAAQIITELLISRQQEKAHTRRQYRRASAIDEEEAW